MGEPSPASVELFLELVRSIEIRDTGPEHFDLLTVGEHGEAIVLPRGSRERIQSIAAEITKGEIATRHYSKESAYEAVQNAALELAYPVAADERLVTERLVAIFAQFERVPDPVRLLVAVGPRMNVPEEAIEFADIRIYRLTQETVDVRWPELKHPRGGLLVGSEELVGRTVAELAFPAEVRKATELAGERLRLVVGVLGMAYVYATGEWPSGGVVPNAGATTVASDGKRVSSHRELFFEEPLMLFPTGLLPSYLSEPPTKRLEDAIVGRGSSPVDKRLLAALHWWSVGNEIAPWSTRLVNYVTALEALLLKRREQNKGRNFGRRAAAFVATPGSDHERLAEQFESLYDLRSACVHEGETRVDPADAYLAMRAGNLCIRSIAGSHLTDESPLFDYVDTMVSSQNPVKRARVNMPRG